MSNNKVDLMRTGEFLEKKLGTLSKEQEEKVLEIIGKKSYRQIFSKRKNCVLNKLVQTFRVWNVEKLLYNASNDDNNFVLILEDGFHWIKSYTVKNTVTNKSKTFEYLGDIESNIDNIIAGLKDDSVIIVKDVDKDRVRLRTGRMHIANVTVAVKLFKGTDLESKLRPSTVVYLDVVSPANIKVGFTTKKVGADGIKTWYTKNLKYFAKSVYLIGCISEFLKDFDVFREYRDSLNNKNTTVGEILHNTEKDNSLYRMYALTRCYGMDKHYSIRVKINGNTTAGLYTEL